MMRSWRPNFQPEHLYFITTKVVGYAHLFQRDVTKRLLLDVLDCFRLRKRMKLFVFVIMPNHLHCIAQFLADDPLADVERDFKRHTADRLLRQMKAEQNQKALDWLASKVTRPDKQSFVVWEDDYLAKDIVTEPFLYQKLEYIHNNPCQPHWQLSLKPEEYVWSSARFYNTDQPCIIPLDDVRKIGVLTHAEAC